MKDSLPNKPDEWQFDNALLPEEPSELRLFFAKFRLVWPWVVAAPVIFWLPLQSGQYVMDYLKNDSNEMRAWVRLGVTVLWMCFTISFMLYMLRLRTKVRAENGYLCPHCKYSLMNLPKAGYCPKCGRPCPKDFYFSFWSKFFRNYGGSSDLVIPSRKSSSEIVRIDNSFRMILRLVNVALSLAILFWLLPSMNCMTNMLRGCKCYSESKEFPQLLSEVFLSATVAFCFYVVVGLSLERQLFDFYLRRNFRSSGETGSK